MLNGMEKELKTEIIKNREEVFQKQNLTQEMIEKEVFEKPMLASEDALKFGYSDCVDNNSNCIIFYRYIDGISTMDHIVSEDFENVKHVNVMREGLLSDRIKNPTEKLYADMSMLSSFK